MIAARERDEDVHLVTQLTNSLLGLIVFPYAHFEETGFLDFKQHKLEELTNAGWPVWSFHIGRSVDLHDLLWHLRNALSHRRVRFSSDDRALEMVEVRFWDRPGLKAPDNWSASISGLALLDFVMRLSELIDRH